MILFRQLASHLVHKPSLGDEAAKGISEGDEIEVDFDTGRIVNHTKKTEYTAKPFPPFMQDLITKGGLMNKVRSELAKKDH